MSKHFENTESSVSSFSREQQSIVSLEESGDDIDEESDSLVSELQSDDSMNLSDEALQSGNVSDDESLPHSADDEENESGDHKISDEHEDVSLVNSQLTSKRRCRKTKKVLIGLALSIPS